MWSPRTHILFPNVNTNATICIFSMLISKSMKGYFLFGKFKKGEDNIVNI